MLEMSSFYIHVPKIMIRWCTLAEIWCVTHVIVISHFGLFFALLVLPLPLTAQTIKILKKRNKHLETSSFYIGVPKIMIRWCTVPEIWCTTNGRTDRRMDGWKKWHVEVGVPPKNESIIYNSLLLHYNNNIVNNFLLIDWYTNCLICNYTGKTY